MISGQTVNWAGVAVGAAVGIGIGGATMGMLGRTQEKVDRNAELGREAVQLREQRADAQQRLDAGLDDGTITVREQRELERTLRELDTQLQARDTGSRLMNENWPLLVGVGAGGVGAQVAARLDGSMNWSYKQVVTRPGSQFDFIGAPIGRATKYGQVRDMPIGRAFVPSAVAGLAGGLVVGMLGARLVQQFANRPS